MFQKRDALLIAAILCAAALAYGIMVLTRSQQTLSNSVDVWVGNVLYQTVKLGKPQIITVEQANGERNVIEISEKGARMAESSCKNQLCVLQGEVTADNWLRRSLGRKVICLPNRVMVELAVEDADQIQRELDLPDV